MGQVLISSQSMHARRMKHARGSSKCRWRMQSGGSPP